MSFLLETFKIPLWFLIFAFGSAAPLWINWYHIVYKKIVSAGTVASEKRKVAKIDKKKVDILKKATGHWNASFEHELQKEAPKKSNLDAAYSTTELPHVKIVLKKLALNGDAGILVQSIADSLEIGSNEIKSSLAYLEENKFVEVVTGNRGPTYYLAARGKKYCLKRGYM